MNKIAEALEQIREANICARKILMNEMKENPPEGFENLEVNSRIGQPAPNSVLFRELFYWIHLNDKDDPTKVYWINLFAEVLDTQSGNLHTVPNVIQFCKNVKYQNNRYGLNRLNEKREWIIESHKNTKLSAFHIDDILSDPEAAHQILIEFIEFVKK